MRPVQVVRFVRETAATGIALLVLSLLSVHSAAAQAPVPPEYQDLYNSLDKYLNAFQSGLNSIWDGSTYPVQFAGALTNANSNSGPGLTGTGYYNGVQVQLQGLRAMGVQAITVEVGFPMLYQPFFSSESDYQQYVAFYQQVAASVRAMGLKLIVENNTLMSSGTKAGWETAPFYATLDWDQYQQARAQTAAVIAQTMQPDYMVVVEEPSTEASETGQSAVNTVDGSTAMLSQIVSAVRATGITVQLGAGAANWQPQVQSFIQAYASSPVDFIDMHLYPVNGGYLADAKLIADIASAAGKPLAMTEGWLWKVRANEIGKISTDLIQARSSYSFWQPLDVVFLQNLVNFSYYTKMAFLTPINTNANWAYLDYDTVKDSPPTDVLGQETALAAQNALTASFTPTAMTYYGSIVTPPDTVPPTLVDGLSGNSGNPSQIALKWNAASDNVGVAGYSVFRDGVKVATSAQNSYQDTGLAGSTNYTYVVQAFDLGGNNAAPSASIAVMSQDVVPPSTPASVTATATSTNQITLAWSPSTDDVAVGSYRIFQGSSPSTLAQVTTRYANTTSWTSYYLTPSTTYYFGIQAVDSSGNASAMSVIVSATTSDLPSPPDNLSATGTSPNQISLAWSPAEAGLPLKGYYVFRGTSASNLLQIAITVATVYLDYALTPGTTYYYAVKTLDSKGNVSALTTPVAATTLSGPSVPAGLTATPISLKQISLAWSPSTGGAAISGYHVFRGATLFGLILLGTVPATAYTDYALAPGTTYYYAVQAVDTSGNLSAMSPVIQTSTPAAPSIPSGLTAVASSPRQIIFSWSPSTGGFPISGYRVFRGATAATVTPIVTVAGNSYTDLGLTPATIYFYSVQAIDTAGNLSGMSGTISTITLPGPSTPANLTASPVSEYQIALAWTASAGGAPAIGYRVYRGTVADNLIQIASVGVSGFTDYALTASTIYYYAVQAIDGSGHLSPMSAVVQCTTLALPLPPDGLWATAIAKSQVSIAWNAAQGGLPIGSYHVFRGDSPNTLTQLKIVSGDQLTCTDYTVAAGTTYYYAVLTADTGGNQSELSAVIEVTTPN
ncbi:MAG: fibronectin type III domain-containing protein [Bryobacteraceae bacterium]